MGLFGPLGSAGYGDASPAVSSGLYGVDPADVDYVMQLGVLRPRLIPNRNVLPAYQQAMDTPAAISAPVAPSATAATALSALAPPLPAMQSLGTFTTRRTQLFGPLSGISI
jgi:hypothetical protein